MRYVGLGKTLFNSSLSTISDGAGSPAVEVFLSERFDRVKNSGQSPVSLPVRLRAGEEDVEIAESSDVVEGLAKERILNQGFPFFEYLRAKGLTPLSREFNPQIRLVGHHHAHAAAAVLRSPFRKALVFVMDGAGSSVETLAAIGAESELLANVKPEEFEHASAYLFDEGKLSPVSKEFMRFSGKAGEGFGTSPGIFYETIAKFIFGKQTDPGKVMGLAPFGKGEVIHDLLRFQEELDWGKSFKGKTKAEWEAHPSSELFRNLAASAQMTFEDHYLSRIQKLREKFPGYDNLILAGGCALNCTANWKLQAGKTFREIYVACNPGDESIGLGCAAVLWLRDHADDWRPLPWHKQNSFLGPLSSVPRAPALEELFAGFHVVECPAVEAEAAQAIARQEIIAWFQGRSECGPRALGHRSILAGPLRRDLKAQLNAHIKFRESFRPYGCAVLWEDADTYFQIPRGFQNPFMSFAVPVRDEYVDLLSQVSHVDGTSRMQTLQREQDELFYRLLEKVRELTGHGLVLNTSLNVMNEPILETAEDALRFFRSSEVDALFIGNLMIRKKRHV